MLATSPNALDVRALVEGEHVVPHFQPLVSLKRRAVVGVEGLSRGWRPETRSLVSAPELFGAAAAQGLTRQLDLLCREKILHDFRTLLDAQPHLVLSLNMDPSAIDRRVWSGYLRTQVAEAGLSPRNIVLEIVESAVTDEAELQRWVSSYRDAGFLVALDDVGAGHSNLNRIPWIKPDVLKVDRYLVSGIDADFYKQEVFRSLLSMSRHLGTMTIAEGVETEGEALTLLDLGADVIQGFLLARPRPARELDEDTLQPRLAEIGARYRDRQVVQNDRKRLNVQTSFGVVEELRAAMARVRPEGFEDALRQAAKPLPWVECFYVLDDQGIQRTSMVLNAHRKTSRQSGLFHPLPQGADHATRDYYYMLMDAQLDKTTYVTTPYVSLATGNLCVTIAAIARDVERRRYVLCMDVQSL